MRSVLTSDAPRPAGPYSQAIVSGDLVWCSGQLGIDPASGDIVGGAKEQAAQCLRNLDAVLKAAGSCSKHIVRTTVLVTDIKFMQGVNEAYSEFFGAAAPSRTDAAVSSLPRGALVEIDAVASHASAGLEGAKAGRGAEVMVLPRVP